MDFLPGLVAPRVGVFVTELGQQTHCVLYFIVIYFLVFISAYYVMLEHWTGHYKSWNIIHNILKQVLLKNLVFPPASEGLIMSTSMTSMLSRKWITKNSIQIFINMAREEGIQIIEADIPPTPMDQYKIPRKRKVYCDVHRQPKKKDTSDAQNEVQKLSKFVTLKASKTRSGVTPYEAKVQIPMLSKEITIRKLKIV